MSSLLSLGLPAVLAAAAPLPSADRAAVEETIRHYFRSGDENAVSELEIAFHPTLGMYCPPPGRLTFRVVCVTASEVRQLQRQGSPKLKSNMSHQR